MGHCAAMVLMGKQQQKKLCVKEGTFPICEGKEH